MPYKQLWFLVEGNDDERLLKSKIAPLLKSKYDSIKYWKYAEQTQKAINNFLKSMKSANWDHLLFADINSSSCVTAKKDKLVTQHKGHLDTDKIIVVIREIESWYLAGLDDKKSKKLGLPAHNNTDNITKEVFDNLQPGRFDSRVDFRIEMAKYFDAAVAVRKNTSFRYFFEKFVEA